MLAMKKIFQRALNTLTLLTIALAIFLTTEANSHKVLEVFAMVLGFGFIVVLIANYVFFGVIALWHKIDKDE